MKLVFAIKALAHSAGGAERVLTEVVNGLASRGHEVDLISYDPPGADAFYALDPRVEWIRLGIGDTQKPAGTLETLARAGALRRIVTGIGPEIAVGFMHSVFIPLGIALLGTGIPMVASEHIVPAHYARRPLQKTLLQLTPWLARRITVVSEQAMAAYPRRLRRRMVVMPNPISWPKDCRADAAGLGRARKVLLSVGRLSHQKNHATLIEAYARIAGRLPDWDLRIIGEGELRGLLEARITELRLQPRISLPGISRRIESEYAAAQLFVLPSLYESQGLALAEALGHGLPGVGFAGCPGVNQLIRPGINGALATGSDQVRALAEALEPLMADYRARAALVPAEPDLPGEFESSRVLDRWEILLHRHRRTSPSPAGVA